MEHAECSAVFNYTVHGGDSVEEGSEKGGETILSLEERVEVYVV